MADWPGEPQEINYKEDDEWVKFPRVERDTLLYFLGTVAEATHPQIWH
jgi:hypothetical protein